MTTPTPQPPPPPTRTPTIEVEPSVRAWRWRILHPITGMTLLTGTAPTRRRAHRAAQTHADQWTHRYGLRHPRTR